MLDRRAIPHQHWQMRLGRSAPALGNIVVAIEDVEQALTTITLTEKGTVPTQPEKCVALRQYMDRRPAWAIPYITRELFDAYRLWEPRIIVEAVTVTAEDYEHWRFPVFWYPRGDVLRDIRRSVILYSVAGRGLLDAA